MATDASQQATRNAGPTSRPRDRRDGIGRSGPWLSSQRVTLPAAVDGHVDRPSLLDRCDPVQRPFTAICAPAGFGKTTLLAAVCRRARQRGHLVAWLNLDEGDDPFLLLSYLFLGFDRAGLALHGDPAGTGDDELGDRLAMLLGSIQDHGTCVLALDEVERLQSGESAALLNRIMRYAPGNLHFALAYREQPRPLEVAPRFLAGRGLVVTADELRFAKPDIARFLGTRPPRRDVAELADASRGWPLALRLMRDFAGGPKTPVATTSLAANWIETRLFRGVPTADRELIEGAALFRRPDADFLDAVLGAGTARRLKAMPVLAGLLGGDGGGDLDIHPLIRGYCATKLSRDLPQRFRDLHTRAAGVFGQRGDVAAGIRHALAAGDPGLAGAMLENAGGIRFWLRWGTRRTRDAVDLLPEETLKRFPRLVLARCALLAASGRLDEADRVYAEACARTDGMRSDREGGSDRDLRVDDLIFRGLRAFVGCRSAGDPEVQDIVKTCAEIADYPGLHSQGKAALKFGLSVARYRRGDFGTAERWAVRTRQDDGRYLWMHANLLQGATAFAQGRSRDAARFYKSIRAAKGDLRGDARPTFAFAFAHAALSAELDLERGARAGAPRGLASMEELAAQGAYLDAYVATADTAAELSLRFEGPTAALDGLERALDFANRTGRPALQQCLAALHAEMLVRAGHLDRADAFWGSERLPRDVDDCVDRERLGWREAEYICRARLQLLAARREFAAGEQLAAAFIRAADAGGLARSLSWALAFAVALAQGAGRPGPARAHLLRYVRLYARTGYARALIRQRGAWRLLREMDPKELPGELRSARTSLLQVLDENSAPGRSSPASAPSPEPQPARPDFSSRELAILSRLDTARDKEIAAELALSESGVRYHVRNIFRKLGVSDRHAAAQCGREFVPPPPPDTGVINDHSAALV